MRISGSFGGVWPPLQRRYVVATTVECRICRQPFKTRIADQKRCPRCIDAENAKRGRQRTVILERRVVMTFPDVCVVRLPSCWQSYRRGTITARTDAPLAFRMTFRGADLDPQSSVRWSGRIDLFADRPYGPRDHCAIDVVEALHALHAAGPNRTETHRYLRLRRPRLIEELDQDEAAPPLGLIWTVAERPVVDDAAMWSQALNNGALYGALVITPTRAREFVAALAQR
jgi:hypothetical protein